MTGVDVDADSVAVARERSPDGIEFAVGSAERLPFAAASFDAVACQQGLQFFEDCGGALSEVRRVLGPQGRLAASVWLSVDEQPVFGAIRGALLRHGGVKVGSAFFARPSSLGQPGLLEDVLDSAGFADVTVENVELDARFPSPLDFLEQYAASTGFGETLTALGPTRRDAIVDDVIDELRDGRLPVRYRLATART